MRARCLYLDLDGTLLGFGASLLHDGMNDLVIRLYVWGPLSGYLAPKR